MTQWTDYADAEVRAFVEAQPRHAPYSAIAAACLEQFGPERAWPAAKIALYWQAFHPARQGQSGRIEEDDEVRRFLDDRLGRLSLRELTDECRVRFGSSRAPSRSAIHRYWQKVRGTLKGS